jgi:hypothetical protein
MTGLQLALELLKTVLKLPLFWVVVALILLGILWK